MLPRGAAVEPVSLIVVPARARHVATCETSPSFVRTTSRYVVLPLSSYDLPARPAGAGEG
jgi:hypothetical protein